MASLAACEGALLIVDATQGVEAQTRANVYLAMEQNLEIIPVINKIDLPSADVERVKAEIEEVLGIDADIAIPVSAKEGTNIDQVLEAIIKYVPPPDDTSNQPLRALVFDSAYDKYLGTICFFKVVDGCVKVGDSIKFMANNKIYEVISNAEDPTIKSFEEILNVDINERLGITEDTDLDTLNM